MCKVPLYHSRNFMNQMAKNFPKPYLFVKLITIHLRKPSYNHSINSTGSVEHNPHPKNKENKRDLKRLRGGKSYGFNDVEVAMTNSGQVNMVAPFSGLKSISGFPVSRKNNTDITSIASNGGRVQCMQVWPPRYLKKFETLSYLPDLTPEQLLKEINYLLVKGWVPCIEFEVGTAFVYRDNNKSPGYYDGRYWTMWKLPMFGCTDPTQVAAEVEEAKKAYPDAHVRIIGFDNVRQVQCISFIAYKP